jgi:hypothetical protein
MRPIESSRLFVAVEGARPSAVIARQSTLTLGVRATCIAPTTRCRRALRRSHGAAAAGPPLVRASEPLPSPLRGVLRADRLATGKSHGAASEVSVYLAVIRAPCGAHGR